MLWPQSEVRGSSALYAWPKPPGCHAPNPGPICRTVRNARPLVPPVNLLLKHAKLGRTVMIAATLRRVVRRRRLLRRPFLAVVHFRGGEDGLEKLDGVAGGVVEDDLFAADTGDDVVAEARAVLP